MDEIDLRQAMVALLPDLRGYARFLERNTAGADDLVQEAVVRSLGSLAQFQPGSNLRAWMFTILRNVFYEQARRRKTERSALEQRGSEDVVAAPQQGSGMAIDDLRRQLFLLTPILREALVLVGAQEMSYEEAAAICGVPSGTMKARVSRARAALARVMTREHPVS